MQIVLNPQQLQRIAPVAVHQLGLQLLHPVNLPDGEGGVENHRQ